MIAQAIEKVLGLAPVQTLEFGHREYTSRKLEPVMPPVQRALAVMTLTAIADYFRADPDRMLEPATVVHVSAHDRDPDRMLEPATVVHVSAHDRVEVIGEIRLPWYQRHGYLVAKTEPKQFQFGQLMGIESFIVALQTYFLQDDTTAALLKIVGNLEDGTSVRYLDDGVTQAVTAKTGIARVGEVALPNPVTLVPYRTFLEVTQPPSRFVFRLQRGKEGSPPSAALFDADGGNWQLQAVGNIRDWLVAHLPEGTNILA